MSNLNLSLKISANAAEALKELDTVKRGLAALQAAKPAAGSSADVVAAYRAELTVARDAVKTKSALYRDAAKASVAVARDAALETARIEVAAARETARTKAALDAVAAKAAAATARSAAVTAAKAMPSGGVAGTVSATAGTAALGGGLTAQAAAAALAASANAKVSGTNLLVASTSGAAAAGAKSAGSSYSSLISMLGGLKTAYAAAALAAAKFLGGAATSAGQLEGAFRSLQTLSNNTGVSFTAVWGIVEKTAASGVVTTQEAADQMRALISAGFTDIKQMEQLVQTANKLALAFPKNGSTPGQSVKDAFDGFRQGQSDKTDNFGMTDNLDDIFKKYAKTINKTTEALDQFDKNQAFANAVIEFGTTNLSGATKKTNEYGEATAKLSSALGKFTDAIGNGVAPLLTSIAQAFTDLLTSLRPTTVTLGIAAEGFRLMFDSAKAFLGLFTGDSWAAVNDKIGEVAKSVALKTATAISGTRLGGWLGIPDNMREGEGPAPGTLLVDTPNSAAHDKKVLDAKLESHAKGEQKVYEQLKVQAEAVEGAKLDILKSGNDAQVAAIDKSLKARQITAVEAARQSGKLETEVLLQAKQNTDAQLARLTKAKAANTKKDGTPFDTELSVKLNAEESTLVGKSVAASNDLKKARIDNEKAVSEATKEMAQEAAAKLTVIFQAQLDAEQTAFESNLALKKAKFDLSLEQRLTSQRQYIEQQKQIDLESIDNEQAVNDAKLENTQKLLEMATNPQERVAAEGEITRLNAAIAASTTKRAVTETEALTKVLQLEESIAAARASLAQKGMEITGNQLGAELKNIEESVRQFERQFAGETDLISERRAIAADERQMASFNNEKRLLDAKVEAEGLAEQKISRLVANGQMTQIEGDRAMLKARLEAGAAIEENAQALERLSGLYPDNAQLKSVAASAREAADALKGSLDTLATEFNRGIADTIGDRILGWTQGIYSFGDAVKGVFSDVFGNVAKKFLNAFTDDLFKALNSSKGQGAGGLLSGDWMSMGKSALSSVGSFLGFSGGGYTGAGGKFDPAGIVHRDEFVFNSEAVRAIGLPRLYAAMNSRSLPTLYTGGSPSVSAADAMKGAFNPTIQAGDMHLSPNLYLDMNDLASKLGRNAQFGRDVAKVVFVDNESKMRR